MGCLGQPCSSLRLAVPGGGVGWEWGVMEGGERERGVRGRGGVCGAEVALSVAAVCGWVDTEVPMYV